MIDIFLRDITEDIRGVRTNDSLNLNAANGITVCTVGVWTIDRRDIPVFNGEKGKYFIPFTNIAFIKME